ncbi:MAG: hypothetical protein RL174_605 [Actinomycetota bacterium]|jgi:tight adherence protein C
MTAIFGSMFAAGLFLLAVAILPKRNLALQERVTRGLVTESSVIKPKRNYSAWLQSKLMTDNTNQKVLFELPDILDLLAVSLSAGGNLFNSLERVAPRVSGLVGRQLQLALQALQLGSSLATEMDRISERLPQRQLVEFCAKVNLSLKRGTPLADLLREQASSARAEIRNQLLKQAGKNETKMLIPLVFLILPVTVLFAIYPSLQMLNLGYI